METYKNAEGVLFTNLCVANTPDIHALCLHPHTQLCMQSVEHTINMSQVIIVYLHDTLIYMVYVHSGHDQFPAWSLGCTFSEESNKQLQLLSPSRCSLLRSVKTFLRGQVSLQECVSTLTWMIFDSPFNDL